jgi:hypothetical protein
MTTMFPRPITSPRGKELVNDFPLRLFLILLNSLPKCFDKQPKSLLRVDGILVLLDSFLENRSGTPIPPHRI